MSSEASKKGKLLVLGGTGFLGQTVCRRALLEGYEVTSLSRRGLPPPQDSAESTSSLASSVDYRAGDARQIESISDVLSEGGYVGKFVIQDDLFCTQCQPSDLHND